MARREPMTSILIFTLVYLAVTEAGHITVPVKQEAHQLRIDISNARTGHELSLDDPLPNSLKLQLETRDQLITLGLWKNEHLDELPVYRISEHGNIVLMENDRKSSLSNQSHYQCHYHGATFVITFDKDRATYYTEGVFILNGDFFQVSPDTDKNDNTGTDDVIGKGDLRHRHLLHKMYRVGPQLGFNDDYLLSDPAPKWKIRTTSRRLKRAAEPYEVEIVAVVDYSLLAFWIARTPGTSLQQRTVDATASLKQYISFVLNSVDLRYQNIIENDVAFRVLLKGIIVSDSVALSTWTEQNKVDIGGTFKVVVDQALVAFRSWVKASTSLPSHDHAMLFTAYEFSTTGIVGLSYVGGVCTDDAVSISTNRFDFQGAMTAAHELGHNLGSIHDDDTTCSAADRFIMAAGYNPNTTLDNAQNPWKFSPCSVSMFRQKVLEMNSKGTNCLTVRGPGSVVPNPEGIPGILYDVDKICLNTVGTFFCRGSYNSSTLSGICVNLYCAASDAECLSVFAPYGTPCGNKKWCVQGSCVSSPDAPEIDETCPFGDSPGQLQKDKYCPDIVADSYNCYSEPFRQRCCQSCKDIERANKLDCLYGDKHPNCETIDASQCYNEQVRNPCCERCPTFVRVPPKPGCEYGDKAKNCGGISRRDCYSSEATCCETCAGFVGNISGCLYGDKIDQCATIEMHLCYITENSDICCEACPQLATGPPGCEWGNKAPGCAVLPKYICYNETYKSLCCDHCRVSEGSCPYGDRSRNCANVERRYCYNNLESCCQTCPTLMDPRYPECLYGDRAPPNNCSGLINAKQDCYYDNVTLACCETCRNLKDNSSPGCEFGNRLPAECNGIAPRDCYNPSTEKSCCSTCKTSKDTSKPGCEYGDVAQSCLRQNCFDEAYRNDCCLTCWGYIPTTTTPTSKPTTTLSKTTTTLLRPTTTLLKPTTTLVKTTTTLVKPTTTLVKPTTTLLKPTTTLVKTTTTLVKPTTTLSKPTTTVPKPTTTASKPTTTLVQPTTTRSKPTTTLVKPTTTRSKPTTTLPKPTTTLPKPTTTASPLPPQTTATTAKSTSTITRKTTSVPSKSTTAEPATAKSPVTTDNMTTAKSTTEPLTKKSIFIQSSEVANHVTTEFVNVLKTTPNRVSSTASPSATQLSTETLIGIGVGALMLSVIVTVAICCCLRRKRTTKYSEKVQNLGDGKEMRFVPRPSPRSIPRSKHQIYGEQNHSARNKGSSKAEFNGRNDALNQHHRNGKGSSMLHPDSPYPNGQSLLNPKNIYDRKSNQLSVPQFYNPKY